MLIGHETEREITENQLAKKELAHQQLVAGGSCPWAIWRKQSLRSPISAA